MCVYGPDPSIEEELFLYDVDDSDLDLDLDNE